MYRGWYDERDDDDDDHEDASTVKSFADLNTEELLVCLCVLELMRWLVG